MTILEKCLSEECDAACGSEVEVRLRDLQEGVVLSRDLHTVRGLLLPPKKARWSTGSTLTAGHNSLK